MPAGSSKRDIRSRTTARKASAVPAPVDLSRTDLMQVRGIKEARARALIRDAGIASIRDLLFYAPFGYLDRSTILPISRLREAVGMVTGEVTVVGRVRKVENVRTKKGTRFLRLSVVDEGGFRLDCYWFNGVEYLVDTFSEGELLALSARPAWNKQGSDIIFTHPKFDRLRSSEEGEPDWDRMFNTGRIIPKYSSGEALQRVGLDSSRFRFIIQNALRSHGRLIEECIPGDVRSRNDLLERRSAMEAIHAPESEVHRQAGWTRMKFEELFFYELMVALRREAARQVPRPRTCRTDGPLSTGLLRSLPFELTKAQLRVWDEIRADLAGLHLMNRLLQGDVGSGKTVVALLACLAAIDSGFQAAIMAPTEILAEQHARSIIALLGNLPLRVRLLSAGVKPSERRAIHGELLTGDTQLVIGTHALIETDVRFRHLGLVVVDEQHRFGVEQRAALATKGEKADQLVMSATPIPRSLAMTLYGDLDVSILDELPRGRKPIVTAIREESQKERLYEFMREQIAGGRQAYIVFPLIERSEKSDLKAATAQFERLRRNVFPQIPMGLVHGRLPADERHDVMHRFKAGEIRILVATTVIEVGIDVPNATMMVIEDAERFGLAQLHQLRGRVGRGGEQSYCVLVPNYAWFEKHVRSAEERDAEAERARLRLQTMTETSDGFVVAEKDLEIRGQGDFFSTQQSGMTQFAFANIVSDRILLQLARDEAFRIVRVDKHLRSAEHAMVRAEFERRYAKRFALGEIA